MQAAMSLPDQKASDSSTSAIRIGIVDDNVVMIHSLTEVFNYTGRFEVGLTAKSGAELFEKLKQCSPGELPEIMITDVNMAGMNGIEVVRVGKALYPSIRFVMLTVFDDEDTLFESIRAGASGYLLKDESARDILSHLESLMEDGSVPMSPRIARKTLDLLAQGNSPVSGTTVVQLEGLSAREKDVLYLLVDGLDYKSIATRLSISPHTVRKHIANVYDKLHISSKAQAIRLVQGAGQPAVQQKEGLYKILLVDDHQIILDSLSMMLGSIGDFEVIGKLNDPTKVMGFLDQHAPDLIISDVSMPQLDGITLAGQVKKQYPVVKMLMLTVSESEDQIREAQRLGVEGYVLKKTSKEGLTKAIHHILGGQPYYHDLIRTAF